MNTQIMNTGIRNIRSIGSSHRRVVTGNPNAQNTAAVASTTTTISTPHDRRERDFGVGYGNSSGYATGKRYASNWGNARFHCG